MVDPNTTSFGNSPCSKRNSRITDSKRSGYSYENTFGTALSFEMILIDSTRVKQHLIWPRSGEGKI